MQGLKELVIRLQQGGVDFVLAGGFGAVSLGSSMVTCDVDVASLMKPFTREQAERGGLKNLYLSTDWGQLDCLGEIKGIGGYVECLAESEPLDIDGATIRVLTLDALIRAKRAMGRPRDLHAVLELEAIREKLRGPR